MLRCSSFAKHPVTDVPIALGFPCLVPLVPRLVNPRNKNLGRHMPKIKCKLCSPHFWSQQRRLWGWDCLVKALFVFILILLQMVVVFL